MNLIDDWLIAFMVLVNGPTENVGAILTKLSSEFT
jgi:hypothetical protein